MNISGNTIFIPGATSGIGLALAQRLQTRGNLVVIGGRRADLLAQLRADHGFGTVVIDTTDPASVSNATADVIARYPELNVLLAMAGIMRAEDWTTPGFLADAEETVITNLLGPIRLIAALTQHLQTRPDAAIITVSSGLAHTPLRVTPTYNASKAAIHMLSESIRLQLQPAGVQVIELVPPAVRTALMPGQETAENAVPLDEYADDTIALLESEPGASEILVERVKFLRYGEVRGDYPQVIEALNRSDVHARS
ncbi:SDR family oxidoreductase [Microlunatus sp. Gsoil 973]|jgi:short-subunit dehydrogenase involved in D-alanine esterification of teichoic acids|uniref:SDR family oxidoreductase n=1 Tax=Microlunatus sp. Gsoil 973 TaxID=2672569 RepID=UPI0012B4A9D4|nr:SDR family NAD(P)-dependent oxidoreductase [Microlunatus sp. Gsoil 973]QGN33582.1 SDR family NAD(P)-dependent oxidoreductase [Microlunatus sp. Gsoil 973]